MPKKKSKTKMPVDIKALMDTVSDLGESRGIKAYVDLVFDVTASDALIELVLGAFGTGSSTLDIRTAVLEDDVPQIALPADLCVIVGGESLLLGDTAAAARRMGTPAVVVVEEGETFFAESVDAAQDFLPADTVVHAGIPASDIVVVAPEAPDALEELGSWIVLNAPAKRLSMSEDLHFLRRPLAMQVVDGNALQNAAVGFLVFIPGADMPVITLNQCKMVLQMASVYGKELDTGRIKEIAAVVASAFGLRALARQLSSFLPLLGWGVKAGVAYFGTYAIGNAALDYFEGDGVFENLSDAISAASASMVEEVTRLAGTALVDQEPEAEGAQA